MAFRYKKTVTVDADVHEMTQMGSTALRQRNQFGDRLHTYIHMFIETVIAPTTVVLPNLVHEVTMEILRGAYALFQAREVPVPDNAGCSSFVQHRNGD